MEYKRFGNEIVVRIDKGEEVISCIKSLSLKEDIKLARVSAIGAINKFTVGNYNVVTKEYKKCEFTGSFEIVSLIGSINVKNGEHYSHLHLSAADDEFNIVGGHLNEAFVSATCELFITVIDGSVDRFLDSDTGLNLFKF